MGCCCRCNKVLLVVIVAILIGFCHYIDRPEHWVFDQTKLKEIAKRGVANAQKKAQGNATSDEIVHAVINEVRAAYPVDTQYTGEWLFNNAGGAMGSMTVLHASFSEYLIIFGTALGTEGHTGRFFADDYFTIIYGEQWAYPADTRVKEVYQVGDQHFLKRHTAKQYRMPDECWALEYARGNIPSMLFFGFADTLSSTLDVVTLYQTVKASAVNMFGNVMRGKI